MYERDTWGYRVVNIAKVLLNRILARRNILVYIVTMKYVISTQSKSRLKKWSYYILDAIYLLKITKHEWIVTNIPNSHNVTQKFFPPYIKYRKKIGHVHIVLPIPQAAYPKKTHTTLIYLRSPHFLWKEWLMSAGIRAR